jgi:benzodiazapine receptor
MKNWQKLLIALALPQAVAAGASLVTITGQGSWYQQINRPEWNPPGWVFGPVWTLLYISMGIAAYLVWKADAEASLKRRALLLWAVQLALNFAWSFIFFGRQAIGAALVEICLLWLAILLTIFAFARISRLAAWLLVPYIAWVSFAALLNAAIYSLNK